MLAVDRIVSVPGGKIQLRAIGALLAVWATASAQTVVAPERVAAIQNAFDRAADAPQLRCQASPIRPALDYGLRFPTGYQIELPMSQFEGAGHSLSTFIRATPEGGEAVYLESAGVLPEVPTTRLTAEIGGSFVVGEGTYDIEALLEDDSHRVCHTKWRIQAKRSGSELELTAAMPPSTVREISELSARDPGQLPPKTGRVTIMIHAAPPSSRLSNLQPGQIAMLAGSLSSLLEQLRAQTVRLVVFNLDQRSVLFQQDGFKAEDMGKVVYALNHTQLAVVDYGTLRKTGGPYDLMSDLLQAELRNPQPSDALILMGPRLQLPDHTTLPSLDKPPTASTSLFYLQYQSAPRFSRGPGTMQGGAGSRRTMPYDPTGDIPPMPPGTSDGIEKLFGKLKGKTIPIRSPHEFADTILRIEDEITCGENVRVHGRTPGRNARPCVQKSQTALPPADSPVASPPEVANHKRELPGEPTFTTPGEGETAARPGTDPGATGIQSPSVPSSSIQATLRRDPTKPDNTAISDADPVEVLMRVRDQVLERGSRIPNHTCVETVHRERYEPVTGRSRQSCDAVLAKRHQSGFPLRLRLDSTDRLRLDVAVTTDREIYSWAGASQFDDGEIDQLVSTGAIGTGPFATHLLAIFEKKNPKFVYEGDTTVEGQRLMEYSYRVPFEDSHYRVKADKEWIITGYTGTLLVDPANAALVRLTVRTDELAPATTDCETDTSLEYGTVQLSGSDYLVPKLTHQRFIGRDGSEAENTVTFSDCRDYRAESALTFGKGPGTAESAPGSPSAPDLDLAPALPISIELAATVNGDRAAAGDRIEGRLAKPIRDASQKTLIPEGALVQGRLMRVETRNSSPSEFTVALRWETIEVNGQSVPLSLIPNHQLRNPGAVSPGGLRPRGIEIELPLPGESRYGVYHFRQERVEKGFRTEWLTGKP